MTVKTVPISRNAESSDKTKQRRTKKARLITRLSTKKGASIKFLRTEFGWQSHTIRAALSGLRSAGHTIERSSGKNGSVYRIVRSLDA